MTIKQVAAPELAAVTTEGSILYMLEGLGFSSDSQMLLIRGKFGDLGSDSPSVFHKAIWVYDVANDVYSSNLNALIAGSAASASTIEVVDAVITGADSEATIAAVYTPRGADSSASQIALIRNGQLISPNLIADIFGDPSMAIDVARIKLSADSRFLALESSSEKLVTFNGSSTVTDSNGAADIYLLDLLNDQVTRVTLAGGAEAPLGLPATLGSIRVVGNEISVTFTSADVYLSKDTNYDVTGQSAPSLAQDTYRWLATFDADGLAGEPSLELVSAFNGIAVGGSDITLGAGIETAAGFFFNSTASDYAAGDTNNAVDAFFTDLTTSVRRVSLSSVSELSDGGAVVAVSESGRVAALLSASGEVAGSLGATKLVAVDTKSGDWRIVSGQSANESVTAAVFSPNGKVAAFTSLADNLTSESPVATYGGLYINDTGLSIGYEGSVRISYWGGGRSETDVRPLAGVDLNLPGVTSISDTTGRMALSDLEDQSGVDDGLIAFTPTRPQPASKAAAGISLSDVIASLKLFLGLSLPANYASPYNYIAADLNANGKVELSDVISLLKVFLNLPVTNTQALEWVFVDAAVGAIDNPFNLSKNNASAPPIEHDFSADSNVDLVGIIRGDVDGSWTAN
ncbi:hypothetical protein [Shewanella sp.]|uniref:hypothetical protein n=1 Tax=Shewanella sp. TaxID=50422 RepID=UPI00404732E4